MPIEIQEFYTRTIIQASPGKIFVFGDNALRVGLKGQAAAARGEPNTIGIATKFSPTEYFSDCPEAFAIVHEDCYKVLNALQRGRLVVWPNDGVGTGLARLEYKAPLLRKYIDAFSDNILKHYWVG